MGVQRFQPAGGSLTLCPYVGGGNLVVNPRFPVGALSALEDPRKFKSSLDRRPHSDANEREARIVYWRSRDTRVAISMAASFAVQATMGRFESSVLGNPFDFRIPLSARCLRCTKSKEAACVLLMCIVADAVLQ